MEEVDRDYRERWKEESRRLFDSSEARKAFQNVFDFETKKALMKLSDRETLSQLHGTIESGKESSIFLADTPEGERVAVKIYMNRAGGFRDMRKYLDGDPRFRHVKPDRRSIIEAWCRKERSNLDSASEVLRCPEPVDRESNILVMEFIGRGFEPFPKLKDVEIENPETGLENTLEGVRKLWKERELVHGDLSEFNILVTDEPELVWIDFSQGVRRSHPEAARMLRRDIENVCSFFSSMGLDVDASKRYKSINPDFQGL